ncbi:MAG: hypothetical protein KGD66_06330 [Candidatus Lokiarchaeota archaeon]|nr:hypothetical protein [Candidatus Lokiarchaeota archaeon]
MTHQDLESEIFAIVETIINLQMRYQNGDISNTFFQKTINNTYKEILKFHFKLKEKELLLSDILDKMNLKNKYQKVLDILTHGMEPSGDISSTQITQKGSSVLALPGITLEITSAFITLMDILKLGSFNDTSLLQEIFEDLIGNINKFPGLEYIKVKILRLREDLLKAKEKIVNDDIYREDVGKELYLLFTEFHDKLNLKT